MRKLWYFVRATSRHGCNDCETFSSPVCCYYAMSRYYTILPHAALPCATIMPCRCIAPFYHTLLSLVLLLCHAEVLHHSTTRSTRVLLLCHAEVLHHSTPRSTRVLLLCHAEVLHHSTPRSSRVLLLWHAEYCSILPHAPLPCAAIMPCRCIAPFYPTLLPCAAIMACRGIAPFYPTLPSLVLLLCHAEVLHHSTPRSSPLCCYYGIPRYCTILPHAPLPCAAIMACRGFAPFYPTLLSLVLLLCHAEVLHHSTPRSSPVCCYYAMSRYCTILPHAPLPCAAIMPCRGIAPFFPTLLALVLLLWHVEVLHHSTPRSSPLCRYYAMPRYCTILPHAPLPCAAIMPCRCIAPFYHTVLSLVLLLWHAEVLHHSTPRSSRVLVLWHAEVLHHSTPRSSRVLLLWHAEVLHHSTPRSSRVLLLCHAEVLHHSTPRSSPLCCYYAMSRYCTILPHAPLVCCYYGMPRYCTILPHAPPVCCYYAMSGYCIILPHDPLPCAAIMACRGIAPFYPTFLSLVLLLCHVEVLHHSTPRSSPLCCYYAMPRYCSILPHAPLPCAAIMPCRCIAPFYPTLLSLVLLLCHVEVLHHSTPRSSPLCCYYAMSRYCTILPHAPPVCCYYAMSGYCIILPHDHLPCAAIMPCRCIAPFYPTLLSLVLLLWHAEVLHHSTPRSSRVLLLWHAEVLHHSTPRSSRVLLLWHAEVLHHSTPGASPLCCYYGMPRYCTILPQAPLPCAAIMPCRGIAPFYPTLLRCCYYAIPMYCTILPHAPPVCCYYGMPRYCTILPHAPLPCAASMPCRGIAPFYPTLLSLVLLLCHVDVLHHSTTRSSPLCCYYGMPRYCTILPHAPLPCAAIMPCRGIAPFYPTLLPCAAIMPCRGTASFYPTIISLVLLLCHVDVLHHSTPRSSPLCCYYGMPRYCTILPHAPPVCCYYGMPRYCTILPHAPPVCCYYGMPRYCTILPQAPLPCAAIMACRGIAPFYPTLLPCAAIMPCRGIAPFYPTLLRCCYYAIPMYCTILPHAPPVCCYYGMPRYCTILPHAPLPCAASMPCRGIAPFYPTLLSLVLLLCHVDVLHHSTTRSSPLCCYYGMPRYCTILPHAPLPCAAIMPCRCIAPFYHTVLSLVLLLCHAEVLHHSTPRSTHVLILWHAELLHHSTPRSSPLCCYYGMPRYCTILPHAPPVCCYYAMPRYCTILPHAPPVCCYYAMPRYCTILPHAPPVCCYYGMPRYCTILPRAHLPCAAIMPCRGIAPFYPTLLPCAAIMPCRGIAPFYPTLLPCAAIMACRGIAPFYPALLSLVLLLCHAEVLHHSTPRSSRVLLLWHAEVLHHSTPRSYPFCCYYAMPRYCTILPHDPLPCAAIMPCRGIAPFYPTLLPCAAIMACRGIAPFYPTLLSLVLLLCHAEVLHHSTTRSSRVLLLCHASICGPGPGPGFVVCVLPRLFINNTGTHTHETRTRTRTTTGETPLLQCFVQSLDESIICPTVWLTRLDLYFCSIPLSSIPMFLILSSFLGVGLNTLHV